MNTAIAIFRRLNEDFISDFPKFADHGEIIEYLYDGYSDPNSHDKDSLDFATYTGDGFKINSKIFFCDHTYDALRIFYMGTELAFYSEGLRPFLRLSPDEETLLKCLSLLGSLAKEYHGDFYNDQLVQGLHILKANNPDKIIYTWVVFAVQLFVDTRRVVSKELEQCFRDAQEIQKWMRATLMQPIRFGRSSAVNEFFKVNLDSALMFRESLETNLKEDLIQTKLNQRFDGNYSWGMSISNLTLCGHGTYK